VLRPARSFSFWNYSRFSAGRGLVPLPPDAPESLGRGDQEEEKLMTDQSARIAELNDRFRNGDTTIPGQIVHTIGIKTLISGNPIRSTFLLAAIRSFDRFTADNDPHGEHDFGSLEFEGEKLFWKIDYYDPVLGFGSQDPADPVRTHRLLTIMLAEEY
jgi:hypothetical protein